MATLDYRPRSILIVDEDQALVATLERRLRGLVPEVCRATRSDAAIAAAFLAKPIDLHTLFAEYALARSPEREMVPPLLRRSLAGAEWDYMQRVLRECDGNISAAARWLMVPRRSLQRRLQKDPPCD
jgi:ActR/RegA family two-component response regulator